MFHQNERPEQKLARFTCWLTAVSGCDLQVPAGTADGHHPLRYLSGERKSRSADTVSAGNSSGKK